MISSASPFSRIANGPNLPLILEKSAFDLLKRGTGPICLCGILTGKDPLKGKCAGELAVSSNTLRSLNHTRRIWIFSCDSGNDACPLAGSSDQFSSEIPLRLTRSNGGGLGSLGNVGSANGGKENPLELDFFVGHHPKMQEVLKVVTRTAKTDATVLIQGESGTGKELIARAIHLNSRRNKNPFIPINCAAIPDNLLESELFGFEQGAFTGATREKQGWFERADQGTIFLDEVGEMTDNLQSKLLRVLQSNEFNRLGSTEFRSSDIRVIAATSKNLMEMTEQGLFRKETYYRLSVIEVNLPPLRERRSDIIPLAEHFLECLGGQYGNGKLDLSEEAKEVLLGHDFPGNVRELEHAIERAAIMADGDQIRSEHLPDNILNQINGNGNAENLSSLKAAKAQAIEKFEREYILSCLEQTSGNVTQAAKLADIHPTNLHVKIKKYHINRHNFKADDQL